MKFIPLSDQGAKLLKFIVEYRFRNDVSPTTQECADHLRVKRTVGEYHLQVLKAQGHIKLIRKRGQRQKIEVLK